MKLRYEESADTWLDEKGFSKNEKTELIALLERFEEKMKKGKTELILLPKGTSEKVAAFFDLLRTVTDERGSPTCFEETLVRIPKEAKDRYSEGSEIRQLENELEPTKTKTAKQHMDPRRRGSKYG